MRVSDDRYTRDRQRLDLGLRLIRHEARTFTIRQWTGLSDDRIRKLYRSYVMNEDARSVLRHRGKSPRQAAFFFRNSELNFQSTQLASLFIIYGLLCGSDCGLESRYRVGCLESGALLCQAFEAYLELHREGHAHSVEVWREGLLVGGIYGVAIHGFFAGESMFHRATDASKIALCHLLDHLRAWKFELFEVASELGRRQGGS